MSRERDGKPGSVVERNTAVHSPDPAKEWTEAEVQIRISTLPRFHTPAELIEALGSRDALLDAYCQGWLPKESEESLEGNYTRLQCWLLARLLRATIT